MVGFRFEIKLAITALSCRLIRFRVTALPIVFPVIIPTRVVLHSPSDAITTASGCVYTFPKRRTRLKSFARVIRNLRFTHLPAHIIIANQKNRTWLEDSSFLPAGPFDVVIHCYRQLMATLCTTAFQYFASIRCGHTRSKTMHANSTTYSWLVCPLGHSISSQSST
jgi:hypothetical protein